MSSPDTTIRPRQDRNPQITSASSLWPLPATAAIPRISPERTWSETPRRAGTPLSPSASTFSTRQDHVARRQQVRSWLPSTSRPTISWASLGFVDPGGRKACGRHLAAAHDGDAVGDREHLVQLVADEDDAAPRRGHRPQRPEQLVDLLRRQDRGGLVHDQDAGTAIEHLQDLHPLLLADGQLPDLGAAGPRAGRSPRPARRSALPCAFRSSRKRGRSRPEQDVLGDGHATRPA